MLTDVETITDIITAIKRHVEDPDVKSDLYMNIHTILDDNGYDIEDFLNIDSDFDEHYEGSEDDEDEDDWEEEEDYEEED
jgi:hypothetical protein